MESNSNDTLVAALLVAVLLALARPAARGVFAALATLTKFAPLVLTPMLATYRPAGPPRQGTTALFVAAPQGGSPAAPPAGLAFLGFR